MNSLQLTSVLYLVISLKSLCNIRAPVVYKLSSSKRMPVLFMCLYTTSEAQNPISTAPREDLERRRHRTAIKMASQMDLLIRYLKVAQMWAEIIARKDQSLRGEPRDVKPHTGFIFEIPEQNTPLKAVHILSRKALPLNRCWLLGLRDIFWNYLMQNYNWNDQYFCSKTAWDTQLPL